MDSTIIVALISLAGIGITSLSTYSISRKQHDKTIALIEYRLQELEKKQDLHNNAVTRLTVLESKFESLDK